MPMRGIRGAITVAADEEALILDAACHLLLAVLDANPSLCPADIASLWFSVTPDLRAAFPARAARHLTPEWRAVPLLDVQEMDVEGALPRCIRLLIHWNTDLPQSQIHPVYLNEAVRLRPDL